MVKGTPSMGKFHAGIKHTRCRRCGRVSFHIQKGKCAACGFGRSAKIKEYSWKTHDINRVRKL
ncbi:MAG: 50S ribosomal protein L37e [Candidatus Aenigmatarchaeota archaeon]|nr:50S ribosomal protein L37e [Candidatus Aenigmarchaeota archaeon]